MTTVIIKHFVILTFTAQARAPQVISADLRGFQARRCFFSSHVMVLVDVVVMFLVVSCFASVHVRSIKVSMAWCSPSLWGQRAAVTAGYSCPPAVPSPPELWSALPPEQRHKLPANTRQPRINYSLQLTRHQDDDDHHRPPVVKHRLPRFSRQRGRSPSCRSPLSALPAAVADPPSQRCFGRLSPTASRSRPPAAGSARAALKSADEEMKWVI